MKKYEPAKMEIVLFDDCAWTDVVTTSKTDDTGVIRPGSNSISLYSYDIDNEYGDKW